MELSSSSIKKFLIFCCIFGNGNHKKLLIFHEAEILENLLYFRKWNFQTQAQKNKKVCPKKKLLYLRKLNFRAPKKLNKTF